MSPYLEEQAEADPLVVFVVPLLAIGFGHFYSGMGNFNSKFFGKCRRNGVRGVDPTIRVDYFFWNFFVVYAVNWIPDILSSGHYHAKGQQDHDSDTGVQSKHRRVDMNM